MKFAFTEEQREFAAAVGTLLDATCTPADLRVAADSESGGMPSVWSRLAEMGVLGATASETAGGLGLALIDVVSVLTEAGRHAYPGPLGAVVAVAVPALGDHPLVESIISGEHTIAVGLHPDTLVADAAAADWLLLDADEHLHLLHRSDARIEAVTSVDPVRRMARVSWTPRAETSLHSSAAARDRAAVAAAAELCGLADTMIAMTVEYATQRHQFGAPIGSFQAVKHLLSDALIATEFAKPLVWRAAYSISHNEPDSSVHSSAAKAAASDAADQVTRTALQVHGAIGYTVEHDLHLFMKRAWALAAASGDARWHRRRIAAALGLVS